MKSLAEEARNQGALAWSMTVRGTVHVNQSEFFIALSKCLLYTPENDCEPPAGD